MNKHKLLVKTEWTPFKSDTKDTTSYFRRIGNKMEIVNIHWYDTTSSLGLGINRPVGYTYGKLTQHENSITRYNTSSGVMYQHRILISIEVKEWKTKTINLTK